MCSNNSYHKLVIVSKLIWRCVKSRGTIYMGLHSYTQCKTGISGLVVCISYWYWHNILKSSNFKRCVCTYLIGCRDDSSRRYEEPNRTIKLCCHTFMTALAKRPTRQGDQGSKTKKNIQRVAIKLHAFFNNCLSTIADSSRSWVWVSCYWVLPSGPSAYGNQQRPVPL